MFPMGTLLFEVSQPIKSGKGMWVSIDTFNVFLGKIGGRYNLKKKEDSQIEKQISMEPYVSKVMETIMAQEYESSTQDPIGNATDEDG